MPLAPPPDICLQSMGPGTLRFCPSPGSLRDLQGLGQVEVEVKSTLKLSRRNVRFAQRKDKLDLAYRRQSHLRDSTVASRHPFPVHALWICGGMSGSEDGSRQHFEGRCLLLPSLTQKFLGDLKVAMMIILLGGVDVLSTSPRHSLCMLYACNAASISEKPSERREGEERPDQNRPRRETPKPEE